MQRPLDRGAVVNNARFQRWLTAFAGYTSPVTRGKIELWLKQFEVDQDVAARVLDALLFIGNEQIRAHYKDLLKGLDGWHDDGTRRKGRWYFVPFSTSSGESGDTMVHMFRMATGMSQRKYNSLFPHPSELVRLRLCGDDTVVLIDDFSATGNQATTAWKEMYSELLSGEPRTFLMLVAATKDAIATVNKNTEMQLVCGTILEKRSNFFDAGCTSFNKNEKKTVEDYCKIADSKSPRGYGKAGLLVVLAHRCPNNSLPILFADHGNWSGLFPRQFS
jgi:hypothetical protein